MVITAHRINVEDVLNIYFSCCQYTFSCLQQPSNPQEIGVFGMYLGAPRTEGISAMRFPLFIYMFDSGIVKIKSDRDFPYVESITF